jgi:hypothetical protein
VSVLRDKDIRGFDVPMDDALVMCSIQGVGDLNRYLQ